MKKALFILILLFSSLEAGSWGAKEYTHNFEETEWRNVYYNANQLSFEGVLPNYDASGMTNDFSVDMGYGEIVTRIGFIEGQAYFIQWGNSSIGTIKSGKKFMQLVEDNYIGANPSWLDAKKRGAKYAVEFTLFLDGEISYCRVFYKNKRMVNLCTTDQNKARRNHFFQSFHMK